MGQTWDPAKQRYVAAGSTKSAQQIAVEQAEAASAAAAITASRLITGAEFDTLVPGPGEIVLGTAAGSAKVPTTTPHAIHYNRARRAKGGVVGTDGKPVISFRIDHGVDDFLSTIWPLFNARQLPCSVGVCPDTIENPNAAYEPTTTTWAQLKAAALQGFEIWSHSATHQDPAVTGNSLDYEIRQSKEKIEAKGLRVVGWQMPGIPGCQTPHYSNNFKAASSWASEVGQRLLAEYGLIENMGDDGGAMRVLPSMGDYDLGHYTLDGMTATQATNNIDLAIAYGYSIQFMLHPDFIVGGTVTHTVANLTTVLDYVKTKRDAGQIEVLTASGLAFADPNTSRRLDLVRDGSFEGMAAGAITGSTTPWLRAGGTGGTIVADGGHTGSKYAHLAAADGYTYVYQGNGQLTNLGLKGHTMMFEAWTRCTVANTEARLVVQDSNDTTKLNVDRFWNITAGSGWQLLRCPFTIPMDTSGTINFRVARRLGSGDLDFDDIRVYPV